MTEIGRNYAIRTDIYTPVGPGASGIGITVDVSTTPLRSFAVQVKGTNSAASSWDVKLEASLDGVNFSQVLQHVTSTGDGAILWATTFAPACYFRSRCLSITLGSALNIAVTILGVE